MYSSNGGESGYQSMVVYQEKCEAEALRNGLCAKLALSVLTLARVDARKVEQWEEIVREFSRRAAHLAHTAGY